MADARYRARWSSQVDGIDTQFSEVIRVPEGYLRFRFRRSRYIGFNEGTLAFSTTEAGLKRGCTYLLRL